ncbi:MAG: leucine-rich repeat domain-containing protein, partial [Muribaculaceae bacterium]|nr:leucine-rich repeat domain-containing protein [Muribaculaceae bacterium]
MKHRFSSLLRALILPALCLLCLLPTNAADIVHVGDFYYYITTNRFTGEVIKVEFRGYYSNPGEEYECHIPESFEYNGITYHPTHIYSGVFSGYKSGVTKVTIPPSIEYIDDNAFAPCTKLNEVFIPSTVKHLGKYIFNLSTISSVKRLIIEDSDEPLEVDVRTLAGSGLEDVY